MVQVYGILFHSLGLQNSKQMPRAFTSLSFIYHDLFRSEKLLAPKWLGSMITCSQLVEQLEFVKTENLCKNFLLSASYNYMYIHVWIKLWYCTRTVALVAFLLNSYKITFTMIIIVNMYNYYYVPYSFPGLSHSRHAGLSK